VTKKSFVFVKNNLKSMIENGKRKKRRNDCASKLKQMNVESSPLRRLKKNVLQNLRKSV
jgi:hypothetical protein